MTSVTVIQDAGEKERGVFALFARLQPLQSSGAAKVKVAGGIVF